MKEKSLMMINVALVLIAVILLLNFFEIKLPSLGKAQYWLGKEEPICVVDWQEEHSRLSLDLCCLEARKQLGCWGEEKALGVGGEEVKVDWVCSTGSGKVLKYYLNNRAYNYCRLQVFW